MTTTAPLELEPGLFLIDLDFQGYAGAVAAYLFVEPASPDSRGAPDLTLIETGPGSTLPALRAGLATLGYEPAQLTRILVTHIHLDHAGAAGTLMREAPHARFYVHPLGAPHMNDPSKLIASAARIYGDDMDRLWGEIAGVPEDRVDLLRDGETLAVGKRSLRIAFTPGHASHHAVIFDEQSRTLFAGDTGGIRMPGSDFVAAPIPPPEFDPEAWEGSIATMRALAPARIALTHFGVYEDSAWHLDQVMPRVRELVAMGEAAGDEISDTTAMTRRFDAFQRRKIGDAATDLMMRRLNLANPDVLAAMGLERYLRKRGEVTA